MLMRSLLPLPGILSHLIPIQRNPGTIGLIPSKVAFRKFFVFEYRIDRTFRTQSVWIVSIEGRLVRWSVDDDGPFGLEKHFWSYRPQNKSIWTKISRGSCV